MAPYTARDSMNDATRGLADAAADVIETGGVHGQVMNNAYRLLRAWRSHRWYGLAEAVDVRAAMVEAFPERMDDAEFVRVLKASAGIDGAAEVSAESKADAVRRLRSLSVALD